MVTFSKRGTKLTPKLKPEILKFYNGIDSIDLNFSFSLSWYLVDKIFLDHNDLTTTTTFKKNCQSVFR